MAVFSPDLAIAMHDDGLQQQREGAVEHDQNRFGASAIPNTVKVIDSEDQQVRRLAVKSPGLFAHV